MKTQKTKPHFEHYCKECKYIASILIAGQVVDVYKNCGSTLSYIMRYSSEVSDYEVVHDTVELFTKTSDNNLLVLANFNLCKLLEESFKSGELKQ